MIRVCSLCMGRGMPCTYLSYLDIMDVHAMAIANLNLEPCQCGDGDPHVTM